MIKGNAKRAVDEDAELPLRAMMVPIYKQRAQCSTPLFSEENWKDEESESCKLSVTLHMPWEEGDAMPWGDGSVADMLASGYARSRVFATAQSLTPIDRVAARVAEDDRRICRHCKQTFRNPAARKIHEESCRGQ